MVHSCLDSITGAIDRQEFIVLITSLMDDTQAPDQILLDKLFTEADIDGNGEVDFEEFSILYDRVKSGELESFGLTNTVNLTARFLGSFFDTADSDEES